MVVCFHGRADCTFCFGDRPAPLTRRRQCAACGRRVHLDADHCRRCRLRHFIAQRLWRDAA